MGPTLLPQVYFYYDSYTIKQRIDAHNYLPVLEENKASSSLNLPYKTFAQNFRNIFML